MLTRAARRHARLQLSRHLAAATLEQLQLPWLCPAIHNTLDFRRKSSTLPPTPSHRKPRDPSPGRPRTRPLPTPSRHLATEAYASGSADQYVPFEGVPLGRLSPLPPRSVPEPEWGYAGLKPFDPSSVMILTPQERTPLPQVKKMRSSGLPGDTALLHENLYALVRVGRFPQAERVVRRLAQIYEPSSAELVDAHHRYLTGRLEALLADPSKQDFTVMQRWFELDIRGRDCAPNSGILAIMIKASFAVLHGSRLDRTARRYISIAEQQGSEVKYDTITSGIFLDSEWSRLLRLFPQEYTVPFQHISDQDIEQQVESIQKSELSPLPDFDNPPAELRPAEQKGLGLKALKKSLQSLLSRPQDPERANEEGKTEAYLRQERLEKDVLDSALERWREEAENTQAMRARGQLSDPLLGSYAYEWIQEMAALVKEETKRAEAAECGAHKQSADDDRLLLSPFIKMADTEKLCAATVIEYLNFVFDPRETTVMDRPLLTTVEKISAALTAEIKLDLTKRSMLEKYHSLPSVARQKKVSQLMKHPRVRAQAQTSTEYLEDAGKDRQTPVDYMNHTIRTKLGAFFLSLFLKVARLPVTKTDPATGRLVTQVQPVAIQSTRWRFGKRIGILKSNQDLVDRLKREPIGAFIAKHLPMTVEPLPWKSLKEGGYVHTKLAPIRFRDSSRSQQDYAEMASRRGDMKQTYAGLDVIGKVPWRINREVFNVLAEAWNTGEAIGSLAPENPPETWPTKPEDGDAAAIRRWKSLIKTAQNERTGFHSQRCYQNFQLEVARAFLNDTFYCPHSVDFRGRAYPIPPYFNHMGADYIRGLFLFARGKELGDTGLRWLKIHLANVYGFDKASLLDREAFSMEHISDVFDSASNPLGGRRWWLTAEDPWQCLAACMEIKNALDSPNPTKYVSHLPVHQDGTCNGLQHYAALGGDIIGAQQVNLMPGDRPADIYSAVADMVKADVHEAALEGNKQAQLLDGKITRKVVKQPVMTNVYGVTYHGARAQVRKQLVDIMPKASLDNNIHLGGLAAYVATLIFKALSRMFTGAHAIQNWLGHCGSIVSTSITPEQISRLKARRAGTLAPPDKLRQPRLRKSTATTAIEDYQFKSTIVWTTPLGMPVVQPYRQAKTRAIRTNLQDLYIQDASASDPVSKRKQLQAFPPNFIHSLDATHMMLSALKCDEIGLQFSSVHDSFWTHAADVPIMNRVLRDAFVRMHTEDVVGRLREEFLARYKGCLTYTAIDARSPLAKRIIALRRARGTGPAAFATGVVKDGVQVDELLEEWERGRLLRSDSPSEQEKGREMVTPAALFEGEPDAHRFLVDGQGGGVALLGEETAGQDEEVAGVDVPGVLQASETEVSETEVFETEMSEKDNTAEPEMPVGDEERQEVAGDKAPIAAREESAPLKKRKPARQANKLHLWMPISFPAAPERGAFDVASLKESQYFFS